VPVQAIPGILFVFRPSAWLWKAIIEKASVVVCPGNASKPAPQEAFGVILTGLDVANLHGLPITVVLGEGVCQESAIVADGPVRHRDGAVWAGSIGVEHHDRLAVERGLPVEHILRLEPGIFPEKVPGGRRGVVRHSVGSSTARSAAL